MRMKEFCITLFVRRKEEQGTILCNCNDVNLLDQVFFPYVDGYLRLIVMHKVVSLVSLRNCTCFPLVINFHTKFSHSFQHDQESRAHVEHNEIHFVMVSSFLPIFFIKL